MVVFVTTKKSPLMGAMLEVNMPWTGPCIQLNVGLTNQSGTKRVSVPMGMNSAAPDAAVIRERFDKLFVGKVINISYKRYSISDLEAASFTGHNPGRYTLLNYVVYFGKTGKVQETVREFYAGMDSAVSSDDVKAFILANRKMPDGSAPTFARVYKSIAVV